MDNSELIESLYSLSKYRTAPKISSNNKILLLKELKYSIKRYEWFTIGIMALSSRDALNALWNLENHFNWKHIKDLKVQKGNEPVFLKANQKNNDAYIRNEYGLGEGILITEQHSDIENASDTWGPFPLDFF